MAEVVEDSATAVEAAVECGLRARMVKIAFSELQKTRLAMSVQRWRVGVVVVAIGGVAGMGSLVLSLF